MVAAATLPGCGGGASLGPDAIQTTFDVGGRSLYLECAGKGGPTVVMDAGLGNIHETWDAVAPPVRKLTRTCTYDRANLGKSDAAPTPRTSAEVVADLHSLLKAAGVRPPYLLVGHSFGGLDVRLFAAQYPSEVSGVVLVDPTPTTFLDGECALVSAALCQELRAGSDPSENPERLDYVKSSAEVDQAGPLPKVPVIVLAATNHQQERLPTRTSQSRSKCSGGTLTATRNRIAPRAPDRRPERPRYPAAQTRCGHLGDRVAHHPSAVSTSLDALSSSPTVC